MENLKNQSKKSKSNHKKNIQIPRQKREKENEINPTKGNTEEKRNKKKSQ